MRNSIFRYFMSFCVIIFVIILSSCDTRTKDDIITDASQYISSTQNNQSLSDHFGYQEGLGAWLENESGYIHNEDGDNSDGITNLNGGNYFHIQDRLYFKLTKQTQFSTGDNFWAYVSTRTGEKHYICPDPLCAHDQDSGCPYIELEQLTFHPYSDTLVYAVKQDFSNGIISYIYEIDLLNNKMQTIYNARDLDSKAEMDTINIYFILNNTLYFRDRFMYEEMIDNQKILTEKTYLVALDLETKETKILNHDFSQEIGSIYIINNSIFYTNLEERTVYCTDFDMKNSVKVMSYEEGYQIYDKYYDENTQELYLLVSWTDIHNSAAIVDNTETINCVLYCIDKDLKCSEIPMPSSLLLDIQLTNEYIYYTAYDPINCREPSDSRNVIDTAGNKIYRVKRTDTTTPELIFDGHSELFFRDFYVTGDYLYMDYYSLVIREGEQVFRRMGSSIRVNVCENTIKWMNLD